MLPSGVLYLQDDNTNSQTNLEQTILYNNTSFNKISKEPLNESSSSAKKPCFITLYLKDEHNKPIANAKIIIKGFK
ncbi:hypothetical protein FZQ25_10105, partial [Campylobacter jejuni]|nr:hypothetical protein [Campylobacter jejuni]